MDAESPERAELLIMGRHLRNGWGGVFEVLTGLLGALDNLAGEQGRTIRLLLPEKRLPLPPMGFIEPVILRRWGRSRLLWDHRTVPGYANRRGRAVLYNPGIVLPAGLRIPAMVSIHDLLYFPRAELAGEAEYLRGDAWYMRRMIQRSLRNASIVHFPSQSTRREAAELFPWAGDSRIRVWPYGVDVQRWRPGPRDFNEWDGLQQAGVREPFFLYAGGLSRRKNVRLLLEAFGAYRSRHPETRLVLTGGAKRTIQEEGVAARVEAGERDGSLIRLGEVSQLRLRLLYRHAEALVYPSRYEGFGLPPLEAQAAGCPVICARSTSIPEVVGEGALFFDPDSVGGLTEAMEKLRSPGVRGALIHKGELNAERSSWERMAFNLLEMADQLGKSSPISAM